MPNTTRDLVYYYPDPMWSRGDWIKNLILFFDGIALLVPSYMSDRPERQDPAIVAGLKQHGLLYIIKPEVAVDEAAATTLADAMDDIIKSGALEGLSTGREEMAEISMSRLGFMGNEERARVLLRKLKERKLAVDTEDGVSIPMHPMVRILVLILLAQILRSHGPKIDADLCPATDMAALVDGLKDMLPISSGAVIQFDLATVTVDLGAVPIDEILGYRSENLAAHRRYRVAVRMFANELSKMDERERDDAFAHRQEELDALAADLRSRSRKAWKKPASFALGLTGAAASLYGQHWFAAAVGAASTALRYERATVSADGPYSYLFNAQRRFAY